MDNNGFTSTTLDVGNIPTLENSKCVEKENEDEISENFSSQIVVGTTGAAESLINQNKLNESTSQTAKSYYGDFSKELPNTGVFFNPTNQYLNQPISTQPVEPLVGTLLQQPIGQPLQQAALQQVQTAQTRAINMLTTCIPVKPKRRRTCRFPGCIKTIKSQGHCQRHGARPKRCKVEGCERQAQGTHDGMCKRHWKELHFPELTKPVKKIPLEPVGESVYDEIIPASIGWKANKARIENGEVMPFVAHLRDNANLEAGWHRNAERASRGIPKVTSKATQLEIWERQLALLEIMLITGTMYSSLKLFAHAWGREKGFHINLTTQICLRRGGLERKKRSDTGKIFSAEEKMRKKMKTKRRSQQNVNGIDGNQPEGISDSLMEAESNEKRVETMNETNDEEIHNISNAQAQPDEADIKEMVQDGDDSDDSDTKTNFVALDDKTSTKPGCSHSGDVTRVY